MAAATSAIVTMELTASAQGDAHDAHAIGPPSIAVHPVVIGTDLTAVELGDGMRRKFQMVAWRDLARTTLPQGPYVLRFEVAGGDRVALEVPVCSGRARVLVDGVPSVQVAGPFVLPLPPRPAQAHQIEIELNVGSYEHRVACGQPPRFGAQIESREGLGVLSFPSPFPAMGGGRAVVFVPPGHDVRKPGVVLVGAHPWNGSMWTYAAYAELMREATARDVVLLMPSGLGNSLYTASAEGEVMRAIDALAQAMAVDPRRVSIWGASMGGAGATTIGLHHPDRFATITSFFGDSKYDLSSYVRAILPTEAAAHMVNALDVVDNARHVPVWLVHGEDDHVSPIRQSEILAGALGERNFAVRFDRAPHMGHEGMLVARFIAEVVAKASEARVPAAPARVTFRSVRPGDTRAYGIHLARTGAGDAFVDVERGADGVRILGASGVHAIELARGAFGTSVDSPPALIVDPALKMEARWDAPSVATSKPAPTQPSAR